jgi:hypothetical protein
VRINDLHSPRDRALDSRVHAQLRCSASGNDSSRSRHQLLVHTVQWSDDVSLAVVAGEEPPAMVEHHESYSAGDELSLDARDHDTHGRVVAGHHRPNAHAANHSVILRARQWEVAQRSV